MANVSIIGFIDKYNVDRFKKILKKRFIDVRDFPNGVPIAWQDKQLKLTGPHEPICDGVFARFGIRDLENERDAIEILTKVYSYEDVFSGHVMAEFWDEEISEQYNENCA